MDTMSTMDARNSMDNAAKKSPVVPLSTQEGGDEVDSVVPCDVRSTDAEGLGLCSVMYNKANNYYKALLQILTYTMRGSCVITVFAYCYCRHQCHI